MTNPSSPTDRPPHTITRVLAASALDRSSDEVVAAAAEWARASGAELLVVHATPEVVATDPLGPWLVANGRLSAEELARQLEDQVRRVASGSVAAGPPARVRSLVVQGTPHRALAETARQHGVDLIVAGAHGEGDGLPGLGSTTDRLVRRADCPVLVIKRADHRPPRRVLATTDLSDLAGDSLHLGLRLLAGLRHARQGVLPGPAPATDLVFALGFFESLELRRAHGLMATSDAAAAPQIEATVRRHAEQALTRFLDRALGDLRAEQVGVITPRVVDGDPRLELLRQAEKGGFDLVITGTHGRGGFDRFLVGSIASRLLAEAPCDVLVVPPRAALAEGISTAVREQTEPA